MARGWESKAVADQIEEGNSARDARNAQTPATPEERAKLERLSSLELSKSRLLDQLERATVPAHRKMLLSGLSSIEKEIEELNVR